MLHEQMNFYCKSSARTDGSCKPLFLRQQLEQSYDARTLLISYTTLFEKIYKNFSSRLQPAASLAHIVSNVEMSKVAQLLFYYSFRPAEE